MRNWKDYFWTKHALERIAEYKLKLSDVFRDFEGAIEVDANDTELLRSFVRHGGLKGLESITLSGEIYSFVVKEKKKLVITVINHTVRKTKKQLVAEAKEWVVVESEDGTKKMKPIIVDKYYKEESK